MTLRKNTARSIILATSALQLAAASLVHANGIQNGGFNPGPGGTVPSWNAHAGAVPFDPQTGTPCDGPAAVAVPVGGGNHRAWLGRRNPVGPGGCTPQAIWQTYNCSPNGEPTPPGTHCVVEFDARFTPGPGGGATSAGVVLRNPAGTNARRIPFTAGAWNHYRLSIPGCGPNTTVLFYWTGAPSNGSTLLIDNVSCQCSDEPQNNLPPANQEEIPDEYDNQLPDPAGPLPTETVADCNGNGLPDVLEISADPAADQDQNGVLDACECLGDLDGSNGVDVLDFIILIQRWGTADPAADIDGDGTVGVGDLIELLGKWGPCENSPPL